jgi:hypothetical protein
MSKLQNQPPEGESKIIRALLGTCQNIMILWTYIPVIDDKMIKLLSLGEDHGD